MVAAAAIEDVDRLLQTLQPSRKDGFMTRTRLVMQRSRRRKTASMLQDIAIRLHWYASDAQWANVSDLAAAECKLKDLQEFHAQEQAVQENMPDQTSSETPGNLCPLQTELRRSKDHPFHARPNLTHFVQWAHTIKSPSTLTAIGEIRSIALFREHNLLEHEYVLVEFGGPHIASSFVIAERAAQLQTWIERLPFGSVGPILNGAPLRETITINGSRERMLAARCAATELASVHLPQDISSHPNDWGAHMPVSELTKQLSAVTTLYPQYLLFSANCRWFARRIVLGFVHRLLQRPSAAASFYWQHKSVTPEVLRRELDQDPFGGRSLSSSDVLIMAEQQLSDAETLRGDPALVSLRSVEVMLRQASKEICQRGDYEKLVLECWRLQMYVHTSGTLSVPRPDLALDSVRAVCKYVDGRHQFQHPQDATDVDHIKLFTDMSIRLALTLGQEIVEEVVETILRVWQRVARAGHEHDNLKNISRELGRVALFLVGIGRRSQDPPDIFLDSAVKVAEEGKVLAFEYGKHPLGTVSVAAESLLSFAESILVALSARPSAPSYELQVNVGFSASADDHASPRRYLVSTSRPGVLHLSDDEAVLLCERAGSMAAEAVSILESVCDKMSAQPSSNLASNAASALRVHAYSLWHATVCYASAADEGDECRRKRASALAATEKAEKAYRDLLYNSSESLRYMTLPVLADVCALACEVSRANGCLEVASTYEDEVKDLWTTYHDTVARYKSSLSTK
ncbi:hypothetical protein FISHEDRAFT_61372 [Fistulina hepatica ATCC 64428]|uniref:Uncharacterized protein n=1 Tax=Fistulina hepatica ATCC 64428 TaxID=1128425 RepID=A0A0D7A489_9AGAR|nr:hypothetical protein FISHEDRAFT_61372 [Fistulina hepatica ATCC 64428]